MTINTAVMKDFVLIQGLKLPVRIGCNPGERDYPQTLEFSSSIAVGQTNCLITGKPGDTVCYSSVCADLKTLTSENEWSLLEQLAEDVTKLIFERYPAALEIELELRKFVIPSADWVGIKIARKREN